MQIRVYDNLKTHEHYYSILAENILKETVDILRNIYIASDMLADTGLNDSHIRNIDTIIHGVVASDNASVGKNLLPSTTLYSSVDISQHGRDPYSSMYL